MLVKLDGNSTTRSIFKLSISIDAEQNGEIDVNNVFNVSIKKASLDVIVTFDLILSVANIY